MNKSIFKAYDIRGLYPDELNKKDAYQIGRSLAIFLNQKKETAIIVGRDMRLSSNDLFEGLTRGITRQGVKVINIGLVSTDALYFACGSFSMPGAMITASHNPKEYNGFKLCQAGAQAIAPVILEPIIENLDKSGAKTGVKKGQIISKDVLSDFTRHLLSFINISEIKPLKIVIDAGNGMAGKIIPLAFEKLPCQIVPMFFILDGSFPNHTPNPSEPVNTQKLQARVIKEKADLGVAFDGDADRAFFINEKGERVSASLIIALIAKNLLIKSPKEKIVYSLVCSRVVKEIIEKYGGQAIKERVGHTFINQKMRATGAIFGGESSGHFYFRDNFFADSGLLAVLLVLEMLSRCNKSISILLQEFEKYYSIEETNIPVKNKEEMLKTAAEKYQNGDISYLDGLTVSYKDWWFNLRPSNTEPLVRFNLEAVDKKTAEEKKEEILKILKQ